MLGIDLLGKNTPTVKAPTDSCMANQSVHMSESWLGFKNVSLSWVQYPRIVHKARVVFVCPSRLHQNTMEAIGTGHLAMEEAGTKEDHLFTFVGSFFN